MSEIVENSSDPSLEEVNAGNKAFFSELQFRGKSGILAKHGEEISPEEFYRFLFRSGSFERLGCPEDKRGNGVAVSIAPDAQGVNHGKLTIVTDGLEQLSELLSKPFVVMSPLSYFGRSRAASNALWMHALTLDIDYVSAKNLETLLYWFNTGQAPVPTFTVNSGHGVHLYYVFNRPIAMYKPAQAALLRLKTALMPQLWNKYTSTEPEKREALGVVQGFRMVGSQTKMGHNTVVTAFKTGERVTLDYINGFVPEKSRAENLHYQPKLNIDQAREKWPDWYERRVVRGESAGRWYVKRDLYDWFKRQIDDHARVGHRYFCMMSLAIYATKCGIDYDELLADAKIYQERMNDLEPSVPFTWEETVKALEAYNEDNVKYPRDAISRLSGVPMLPNKRNGRKQEVHLRGARAIQEINDEENGTSWREFNGRPVGSGTKANQIRVYAAEHPEANHSQIARALSVSRTTVVKWLKA